MRIHQVAPFIYHTYKKIWVNRDWASRFFSTFFLVISEVGSQIYIANFKIWVFSATFLHEITLYAIDVDKKRFITFFNTLEPLWKTALHRTQLYGTVATVSYLSVQTCSWVEVRSFFLFCGFAQKLWFRLESLRLWYISAWEPDVSQTQYILEDVEREKRIFMMFSSWVKTSCRMAGCD